MSGWEKIIKTPKMVKTIENCSNHIGKSSRSMYDRQFDMCVYIVNKFVKQEMTKVWVKFIPKSLTRDQRDDIDYISRM